MEMIIVEEENSVVVAVEFYSSNTLYSSLQVNQVPSTDDTFYSTRHYLLSHRTDTSEIFRVSRPPPTPARKLKRNIIANRVA
jgi:hypothetical protein